MRPCLFAGAIACVSLIGALAGAQEGGTAAIVGRVVDADVADFGIAGATVWVEGTEIVGVADDTGSFALAALPGRGLTLSVEAPGYRPSRIALPVELRGGPLVVALTSLDDDSFSVTVTDARSRADTASTSRITPREMTAAPRRNAEELLRQVPGLTLVQHGSEGKGHQFFLRGFDAIHGADLELTLDGIPVNEWSNVHAQGYIDLGFIIPELLDGVVVTKGPFTLEQGAFAMAGSADYRLGVPADDLGWRAAYTIGSTSRHRVFAAYSPSDSGGREFVGVEATHDEGFGENRGLNRATINTRVGLLKLEDGSEFTLLGLGGYSRFELPGTLRNDDVEAGMVDFYGTYDPRAEGSSQRALVALTYGSDGGSPDLSVTAYGGVRQLELVENYTGFLVDPIEGDRRAQHQETWSFGLFALSEVPLAAPVVLRTGVGVRGDVFGQTEDHLGRGGGVLGTRRDLAVTQLLAHALAGLCWSPNPDLRVDVGGRVEAAHVGVRDHLQNDAEGTGTLASALPRITARWSPVGDLRLYAAYGRGFRPPEARAFSEFDAGRSGISEEVASGTKAAMTVSDAVELGSRWDPSSWLGLNLSGFATFIERESIFDHVSGVNLELNGTRRVGGEIVVVASPISWLTLSTDLTVTHARFIESGREVPMAPWLTSGFHAVVSHDSGFLSGVRVLAVAPRTLPHGATGATLLMADATLGYHWRWLRLDLEVENILNRELREGEYHYASYWHPAQPGSELPVLHTTAGPPLNARLTVGLLF